MLLRSGIGINMNIGSVFDNGFGNVLYNLWLSGKSFSELTRMYEGTPNAFKYYALLSYSQRYKWKERRRRLANEISDIKKDDESVKIHIQKSLTLMQSMISYVEQELSNYLANPMLAPRPRWMPDDATEIINLLKMYHYLVNDGVDRTEIDVKHKASVVFEIPDDIASQALKLLSEAKTDKLLSEPFNPKSDIIEGVYTIDDNTSKESSNIQSNEEFEAQFHEDEGELDADKKS